ncbi:hypothetical protein [Novosphingobium lindaniclasticum]
MKSERAAQRYRQAVNFAGNKQAIERAGQALINALWAGGASDVRTEGPFPLKTYIEAGLLAAALALPWLVRLIA